MNIWLISQSVNSGYDTYDSAVVAAETEEDAKNTKVGCEDAWALPEHVNAELIGEALPDATAGVILASFNAG